MAIEKMMLVRATGPIEKLNEFNLKTLPIDYYNPEVASNYFTGTAGYTEVNDPCPFDRVIQQIEDISAKADGNLTGEVTNVLGTEKPLSDAYIKTLIGYLSENDFDLSDINAFLSGLKSKLDNFSEKQVELSKSEKKINRQLEMLKHFTNIDVDISELMNTSYIDVHFGRMPKDSMVKLYMYNNDNKFLFNTYSSDEKSYWGVYCAPKQYADEAKKIMDALYFEELEFDFESGNIAEIISECKKELEIIKTQQDEINNFWKDNKDTFTSDYSVLLDLQKLWALRSYAVKQNDTFLCLGWIPKHMNEDAKAVFSSVSEIEFTIKDPESSVTAAKIADSSPFERPIRDIEHLAHHVNYDLSFDNLHNVIGNNRPLTDEYLNKFARYLGGVDPEEDGVYLTGINSEIHIKGTQHKELKVREQYLKKKIARLNHFTSSDVDLKDLKNTEYSVFHFGRIPNESVAQAKKLADGKEIIFNVYSSDDKNSWCIYCSPRKYDEETKKTFDLLYFKEYKIDETSGTVAQIIKQCNDELSTVQSEKQLITDFWNEHKDEIIDRYSILQDLQKLWLERKNITVKNGKFKYSGHLTKRQKTELQRLYEAVGGFENIDKQDSHSQEQSPLVPPTKLRNHKIFRPYEYYVEMYGMPNYGSVDITSFVAITYTVIFGMMFGDLGQGFVLLLAGVLAWKVKKMALGKILIPCGISSMIFGLIFGSFFGYEELLDPLYKAVGLSGKPLSVMDSINTVLLVAIGIGIGLVAVAICINIYSNLKAKLIGAALFDNNGIAGLALYLCGVNLASHMMGGPMPIPTKVCAAVMAVCAIILFFKEILIGIVDKHDNWKPDSIADFIMQNVFEMLEYVLSYFSNTVSFLRVGAFVLVHAGMMMVVFSLAGDSGNIFVVILGNILVICLEGLLTGIQALRLEFYEMFSRCFEGSGKPFISSKSILSEQTNK